MLIQLFLTPPPPAAAGLSSASADLSSMCGISMRPVVKVPLKRPAYLHEPGG